RVHETRVERKVVEDVAELLAKPRGLPEHVLRAPQLREGCDMTRLRGHLDDLDAAGLARGPSLEALALGVVTPVHSVAVESHSVASPSLASPAGSELVEHRHEDADVMPAIGQGAHHLAHVRRCTLPAEERDAEVRAHVCYVHRAPPLGAAGRGRGRPPALAGTRMTGATPAPSASESQRSARRGPSRSRRSSAGHASRLTAPCSLRTSDASAYQPRRAGSTGQGTASA